MREERDLDITMSPSTITILDTNALDNVDQLPELGMLHNVWNGYNDRRKLSSRQLQLIRVKLVKPPTL